MVLLTTDKLAAYDFVTLIPDEPVQRLDDGMEVEAFGYSIHPILTFRGAIVIVRALEDEAPALEHRLHLRYIALQQQP